MALFRRKPDDRFHVRRPRTAGAIGGSLGGAIVAAVLYAIANAFDVDSVGLTALLASGVLIGGVIGATFPRVGHRSLFYVWCMALGI
jgi:hypothetical protein